MAGYEPTIKPLRGIPYGELTGIFPGRTRRLLRTSPSSVVHLERVGEGVHGTSRGAVGSDSRSNDDGRREDVDGGVHSGPELVVSGTSV